MPEHLRRHEADIIASHRHGFWFDKIEVENIYNEALNRPLNTTIKEELTINIIYVKDEQTYFSFNKKIEADNDFLIVDPVVRVLTVTVPKEEKTSSTRKIDIE